MQGVQVFLMNRRLIWSLKHIYAQLYKFCKQNPAHRKAFNWCYAMLHRSNYPRSKDFKVRLIIITLHVQNYHTLARITIGATIALPGYHFPMIPSPKSSGNQITINRSAQPNINNRCPSSLIKSSFLFHVRVKQHSKKTYLMT